MFSIVFSTVTANQFEIICMIFVFKLFHESRIYNVVTIIYEIILQSSFINENKNDLLLLNNSLHNYYYILLRFINIFNS